MEIRKLRRTMLFCPATNPTMYIDAQMYKPDCILFDLEDAVRYDEKDAARDLLAEAIKTLNFGNIEVFARINPLYTEFGAEDVKVLVPAGLRRMRLPMCEKVEQVIELDKLLTEVEREHGIEEGSCQIQCSLETPLGVWNALEIATASPRVTTISFGAEDYTRLLGVDRTKDASELQFARQKIANAASIAKVDAIDTVWADFKDIDGFVNEVKYARQIGFAGKSCIHPSQVGQVHDVFTPNLEDVEKSLVIIEAAEKAGIEKGGVVQVNGKMVDIPVIEKARRIVGLAKAAGLIK